MPDLQAARLQEVRGQGRTRVRRSPFLLIGLAVLLMAALVYVAASACTAGRRDAVLLPVRAEPTPALPFEAGVFRRQDRALDYAAMAAAPKARRTLARVLWPPGVPRRPARHPASGRRRPERRRGLSRLPRRRRLGSEIRRLYPRGAASRAPELPPVPRSRVHAGRPDHRVEHERAVADPWRRAAGSPPPIPHALQMRENCLACHAGPGAVLEIRSTHPERWNCRQCHALGAEPVAAFERPADTGSR